MPTTTNKKQAQAQQAIAVLQHLFADNQRVAEMFYYGVEDKDIKTFIATTWPELKGGVVSPSANIEYSFQGGKSPKLWLTADGSDTPIANTQLINTFRAALNVPVVRGIKGLVLKFATIKLQDPAYQKALLLVQQASKFSAYYEDAVAIAGILGIPTKLVEGTPKVEILIDELDLVVEKLRPSSNVAIAELNGKKHVVRIEPKIEVQASMESDDGEVIEIEEQTGEVETQTPPSEDFDPQPTTPSNPEQAPVTNPSETPDQTPPTDPVGPGVETISPDPSDPVETISPDQTPITDPSENPDQTQVPDPLGTPDPTPTTDPSEKTGTEIVDDEPPIEEIPIQQVDALSQADRSVLNKRIAYMERGSKVHVYLPKDVVPVASWEERGDHKCILIYVQGRAEGTNLERVSLIKKAMLDGKWNWEAHPFPQVVLRNQDGVSTYYLYNGIKRAVAFASLGISWEYFPISILYGTQEDAQLQALLANQEHDDESRQIAEPRSETTKRWLALKLLCAPRYQSTSQNKISQLAGISRSTMTRWIEGMIENPYFVTEGQKKFTESEKESLKITPEQLEILNLRHQGKLNITVEVNRKGGGGFSYAADNTAKKRKQEAAFVERFKNLRLIFAIGDENGNKLTEETLDTKGMIECLNKAEINLDEAKSLETLKELILSTDPHSISCEVKPSPPENPPQSEERGDPTLFPINSKIITVEGCRFSRIQKPLKAGEIGEVRLVDDAGYFVSFYSVEVGNGYLPASAMRLLTPGELAALNGNGNSQNGGSSHGGSRSSQIQAGSTSEQIVDTAGSTSEQIADAAGSTSEQIVDTADSTSEQIVDAAGSTSEQIVDAADSTSEQIVDTADSTQEDTLPIKLFMSWMLLSESNAEPDPEEYTPNEKFLEQVTTNARLQQQLLNASKTIQSLEQRLTAVQVAPQQDTNAEAIQKSLKDALMDLERSGYLREISKEEDYPLILFLESLREQAGLEAVMV